jgi:hypothetical protein
MIEQCGYDVDQSLSRDTLAVFIDVLQSVLCLGRMALFRYGTKRHCKDSIVAHVFGISMAFVEQSLVYSRLHYQPLPKVFYWTKLSQ